MGKRMMAIDEYRGFSHGTTRDYIGNVLQPCFPSHFVEENNLDWLRSYHGSAFLSIAGWHLLQLQV